VHGSTGLYHARKLAEQHDELLDWYVQRVALLVVSWTLFNYFATVAALAPELLTFVR
jgi:hypothetical protein